MVRHPPSGSCLPDGGDAAILHKVSLAGLTCAYALRRQLPDSHDIKRQVFISHGGRGTDPEANSFAEALRRKLEGNKISVVEGDPAKELGPFWEIFEQEASCSKVRLQ